MSALSRHLRLLPAVMAMGGLLLMLKIAAIATDARAQAAPPPAPKAAAAMSPPKAAAPAAAAVRSDDDGDDPDSGNAAAVDVMGDLSKRRAELDRRSTDLDLRQSLLEATEKRVDDKIATLKTLQTQMTTLLAQRDTEQQKEITALVKTYSAMKPQDAARILDGMDDSVRVPVANAMKPDALAPILAQMSPADAQKLTLKLADRLALPKQAAPIAVADAAAPKTNAEPPGPQPALPPPATASAAAGPAPAVAKPAA